LKLSIKVLSQEKEKEANIDEMAKLRKKINLELDSRGYLLDENDELQRKLDSISRSDR